MSWLPLTLLLLPIAAILIAMLTRLDEDEPTPPVAEPEWPWPLFGSFRRRPYDQIIDDTEEG